MARSFSTVVRTKTSPKRKGALGLVMEREEMVLVMNRMVDTISCGNHKFLTNMTFLFVRSCIVKSTTWYKEDSMVNILMVQSIVINAI